MPPGGFVHCPPSLQVAAPTQSAPAPHAVAQAVPAALHLYGEHCVQSMGISHWKPPPTAAQDPRGSQLCLSSSPAQDVRHIVPSGLHAYGEHIAAQQLPWGPGAGGPQTLFVHTLVAEQLTESYSVQELRHAPVVGSQVYGAQSLLQVSGGVHSWLTHTLFPRQLVVSLAPVQEVKHDPRGPQLYRLQSPAQPPAPAGAHVPPWHVLPVEQSAGSAQALLHFWVSVLQVYAPQPAEQGVGAGGAHLLELHAAPATTQSAGVAQAVRQAVLPGLQAYVSHEEQSKVEVAARGYAR